MTLRLNHLGQPNVGKCHVRCSKPLDQAATAPLTSVGYLVYRSANRMRNQAAILVLVLSLVGCTDGRPKPEEARRHFELLYPDAEVISVQKTEDEVIARSYRFRYRRKEADKQGEIEIQFVKPEAGDGWIPRPTPPKTLP